MKVQREQLETLPVAQLKEIAKANDIKGIASMKKAALIDAILQMSESIKCVIGVLMVKKGIWIKNITV